MNCSLAGMRDAWGLDTRERDVVDRLVTSLTNHAEHNQKLDTYYDATFTVEDYGIKVDPEMLRNEQVSYWPEKAVDALADRVRLIGLVGPEGTDRMVAETGLVEAYQSHLVDKYVHGCMFAVVGRSKQTGRPFVRFHDAEGATALPSPDHDPSAVAAGLAVARTETTPWSHKVPVPTVVNAFLPGLVIELRQDAPGHWRAERMPTAEPTPMVVAFAHRPRSRQPFGKTRISRAVRCLTDGVVRTMFRMEVLSAFYTMPQRYAIGLSRAQFDKMVNSKAERYADAMFLATKDADGDRMDYGQLSANSPEPFIAQARFLAGAFSGATGVPLNSLGIVQDNPSSAEAITASREDVCLVARKDIDHDRRSLARVARLLAAVDENVAVSALTDERRDVEAAFEEPMLTSLPGCIDAVTKLSSVIEGFGSTAVAMRMAGLSEADIKAVKAELRQAQARLGLAMLMERREGQDEAERQGPTPPEGYVDDEG